MSSHLGFAFAQRHLHYLAFWTWKTGFDLCKDLAGDNIKVVRGELETRWSHLWTHLNHLASAVDTAAPEGYGRSSYYTSSMADGAPSRLIAGGSSYREWLTRCKEDDELTDPFIFDEVSEVSREKVTGWPTHWKFNVATRKSAKLVLVVNNDGSTLTVNAENNTEVSNESNQTVDKQLKASVSASMAGAEAVIEATYATKNEKKLTNLKKDKIATDIKGGENQWQEEDAFEYTAYAIVPGTIKDNWKPKSETKKVPMTLKIYVSRQPKETTAASGPVSQANRRVGEGNHGNGSAKAGESSPGGGVGRRVSQRSSGQLSIVEKKVHGIAEEPPEQKEAVQLDGEEVATIVEGLTASRLIFPYNGRQGILHQLLELMGQPSAVDATKLMADASSDSVETLLPTLGEDVAKGVNAIMVLYQQEQASSQPFTFEQVEQEVRKKMYNYIDASLTTWQGLKPEKVCQVLQAYFKALLLLVEKSDRARYDQLSRLADDPLPQLFGQLINALAEAISSQVVAHLTTLQQRQIMKRVYTGKLTEDEAKSLLASGVKASSLLVFLPLRKQLESSTDEGHRQMWAVVDRSWQKWNWDFLNGALDDSLKVEEAVIEELLTTRAVQAVSEVVQMVITETEKATRAMPSPIGKAVQQQIQPDSNNRTDLIGILYDHIDSILRGRGQPLSHELDAQPPNGTAHA